MKPAKFIVRIILKNGLEFLSKVEALTPGMALISAVIDLETRDISPTKFLTVTVSKEK